MFHWFLIPLINAVLEGAKVLQQFDKKLIPIVSNTTLAIIDQQHQNTTSKYSHSDNMHAFPVNFGLKGEALSSTSDVALFGSCTLSLFAYIIRKPKEGLAFPERDSAKICPTCREDDLLCMHASPFPHCHYCPVGLGFTVHLSSLYKLNASNGSFGLLGYISGIPIFLDPCNADINSKGPYINYLIT
uniref:Xylanase inhibitor N-terminal domain-containing protein n=1 Tax=Solanum lycopersicum TaxID=4081 RepID=A0A3Q7FD51_SOLLC